MNKHILWVLLLGPVHLFCGQVDVCPRLKMEVTQLTAKSIIAVRDLHPITILHARDSFAVIHEGEIHKVNNYNISSDLRGISTKELQQLLSEYDACIKVQRKSDNSFALELFVPLHGGGAGGATTGFFVGKWLTHFVFHVGVGLVSASTFVVGGPIAVAATFASLEATFGPVAEGVSNVVGLGTGIIGGIATGPV